jgi:hypothetical protein
MRFMRLRGGGCWAYVISAEFTASFTGHMHKLVQICTLQPLPYLQDCAQQSLYAVAAYSVGMAGVWLTD